MVKQLKGVTVLNGEFISYVTPGVTAENLDTCDPQW